MSTIEWLIELGAALAVKAAKLKRVVLPPKLEGAVHTYPDMPENATVEDWPMSGISYYALHVCVKCGLYNEKRAAYTTPPCREKPPSVIVELP